MGKQFTDYDTSEFLETEEDIILYLREAAAIDDPKMMQIALGKVARARGMTQLAKQTGLSRESLYKSLSVNGNPSYATISRILEALGARLSVEPLTASLTGRRPLQTA